MTLIKKIFKNSIFNKCTVLFIICNIIISLNTNHIISNTDSVSYLGGFVDLSNIIMIVLINNTITKELKKSKIHKYLYCKNNALQIFIINILALILFYFFLLIIAILLTTIINTILFHFNNIYFIFNNSFLIFIIGDMLNKFLLLSIVSLFASTTNPKYKISIVIGLMIFIFGNVISTIFIEIMQNHIWLRWNPFNFLLINLQLSNKQILGTPVYSATLFYGGIYYIISGYYFIKKFSYY